MPRPEQYFLKAHLTSLFRPQERSEQNISLLGFRGTSERLEENTPVRTLGGRSHSLAPQTVALVHRRWSAHRAGRISFPPHLQREKAEKA